jgi:hypothetical protein
MSDSRETERRKTKSFGAAFLNGLPMTIRGGGDPS